MFKIVKQTKKKTLVICFEDAYLKQREYLLIKNFTDSVHIDTFRSWYKDNQRTSRRIGKKQFFGKEFIAFIYRNFVLPSK